jgi:hypothetical protein
MSPFYLSQNPLERMPAGMIGYVYATVKPRFFAELYKLTPFPFESDMYLGGSNVLFNYRSAVTGELEHYVLVVKHNLDEAKPERLQKALHKAAEWYATVLAKSAGKVAGKSHELAFAGDFNAWMPNVKILQLTAKGWYLLSQNKAVECFEDFAELQDYLVEFQKYPVEAVEQGLINIDKE